MNIAETTGKIKGLLDRSLADWGLFVAVFLVALAAFGLGRLSALESPRPPVSLGEAPVSDGPRALALGGLYVASKSGTVYYYPWCGGAQKLLPQNERWFADEASAKAAGYAPSKSCKGLGSE